MTKSILYYCRTCAKVTTEYDMGHVCKTCGSKLIVKESVK